MRRPAETSEETDSVSIDQYLATTPLARDVLACLTDVDSLTRDNLLGEVVQWGARDSTDHERV